MYRLCDRVLIRALSSIILTDSRLSIILINGGRGPEFSGPARKKIFGSARNV